MDRLCDQVDLLLKENKELFARLRNLEHLSGGASSRSSVASVTRASFGQSTSHTSAQSTTSRSSHVQPIDSNGPQTVLATVPVAPTGTKNEPPRISAFEEQLHRSRVYRHAQANHSESSLVDDGRSTLALSICSSLTLGEVSNISVFALPVFAMDLSNASAYKFVRSSGITQTNTPRQMYGVKPRFRGTPKPRLLLLIYYRNLSADDTEEEPTDRQQSLGAYMRIKIRNHMWPMSTRLNSETEQYAGVFGVPLQTSIRYANVAISLVDDDGESHTHGYVPILIAMTGVFLKENGKYEPIHMK